MVNTQIKWKQTYKNLEMNINSKLVIIAKKEK